MTLSELYFENIGILLWILIPLLLLYFSALIARTQRRKKDIFIVSGLMLVTIIIVGLVRLAYVYELSIRQVVVNLEDKIVRNSLETTGISCLLKEHKVGQKLEAAGLPRPTVFFKKHSLIFLSLDKNKPKQSIKALETACLEDMVKTQNQKENEAEQAFIQTISSGVKP